MNKEQFEDILKLIVIISAISATISVLNFIFCKSMLISAFVLGTVVSTSIIDVKIYKYSKENK